jgi:hypothetical protein
MGALVTRVVSDISLAALAVLVFFFLAGEITA